MKTYWLGAIDIGWEHLPTVTDTIHQLSQQTEDGLDTSRLTTFLKEWEQAKKLAKKKRWEGDFRIPPRVFFLPNEVKFEYGFVFKQDNNGTTFVISPRPLPWLPDNG